MRRGMIAAIVLGVGSTAVAREASAQDALRRFSARAEFGVGTMIPTYQRQQLGYEVALQFSTRLGFAIAGPFGVQAAFSYWNFPNNAFATGGAVLVGGGLYVEPRLARIVIARVDANVGAGFTGEFTRWMVDMGTQLEFDVRRWMSIGPALRFGFLFRSSSDVGDDPVFWSGGVSATFRVPPREVPAAPPPTVALWPARPTDSDHDGLRDTADACPTEPMGIRPDLARLGCPTPDTDGDLVYDDLDECRDTPRGEHPDPQRHGCPDLDDDGDLVLNHADTCRDTPAGQSPDSMRPGCPLSDRDGDSIPDIADACPSRAGVARSNPRRNGCPGPGRGRAVVAVAAAPSSAASPAVAASAPQRGRGRRVRGNGAVTAVASAPNPPSGGP